MTVTTWHGARGAQLLGPTEDRVARWLAVKTKHGRARIRSVDAIAALRLERSEWYRVTRRLRILGLFGIADDRAGARGGRLVWRTSSDTGVRLDAGRKRAAIARMRGQVHAAARRLGRFLASGRTGAVPATGRPAPADASPASAGDPGARQRRRQLMLDAGLSPALAAEWGWT